MNKILFVLCFLVGFSVNAYSQEPFDCDSSFYQVFTPNGQLITYDVLSNSIVTAPNNAGTRLNAFGYRIADDFAYGLIQSGANLARLGSDGIVANLGPIAGYPVGPTASGDFYTDGLLYVMRNQEFNTIYAINVDTVSVEKVINIAGPNFFVSDIALNPIDGLFYGVTQVTGVVGTEVPPALLIAIDVETGTFEIIGPTNLSPGVVFGSMYADGEGNVYGSKRTGAPIFYQFDTETGNPTALGESVTGGSIDGFFCSANLGPFPQPTPIPTPTKNIPTLSEWGLIAMAGVMGVVGFMVLRRRKVAA